MYAGVMLYFFYSHPPSKFKICNMTYGFETARRRLVSSQNSKVRKGLYRRKYTFLKKTLVHVCILSKYYMFIIDSIRVLLNSEV